MSTTPSTTKTTRRQPESNVAVYDLGHYEQMLLALALRAAFGDVEAQKALTENSRLTDLAGLVHLFDTHGTVAVVRTNESE